MLLRSIVRAKTACWSPLLAVPGSSRLFRSVGISYDPFPLALGEQGFC